MTLLKIVSLTITIGVIIFTYIMAGQPGFRARSFSMLSSIFIMLGVPTLLLMAMCLSTGKWAGFFLLCSLVSAWAIGSVGGYAYAHAAKKDAFKAMVLWGMWAMILAGTPLAVYLLP